MNTGYFKVIAELKKRLTSEKNRLKAITKGKEIIVIDNEPIEVTIMPNTCYIYLNHIQKKEYIQKTTEAIELIFERKLVIKYKCNNWIIPEGFQYRADGLYAMKTKKRDGVEIKYYEKISIKWLFIEADVYSKEYNLHQYEVKSCMPLSLTDEKIEICEKDTILKRVLVISFLANKLNAPVDDEYRADITRFFTKFIEANNKNLKRKNTVPTLGWNKDFTDFAPYSQNLHIDYSKDRHNYFKNLVTGFEKLGNKQEFLDRLIIHASNPYADFAISSAFAAPLLKLCGVRSFLLNYYGKSKNMKSLSARIGLAAFGDTSKLEMSGHDTINVIKAKLHKLQNSLCYIDDIIQKGKNTPIISGYDIGNERDRHRLDKNSEILETKIWRTIAFCSSESPISKDNDMLGEINRTLELGVDCRPEAYKNDEKLAFLYANDYYNFLSNNYGLLGEEYIKNIIAAGPATIKKWYSKILKELSLADINLSDHISSISIICLGNYFYRKMFFGLDNINYSIELGKKILKSIKTKEELKPTKNVLDDIYTFFEVNKNYFVHESMSGKDIQNKTATLIYGKVKNDEIFFILKPLKDYLEKNGWDWSMKKQLIDEKLIKYEAKSINGTVGKRIIIPLIRDDLEDEEERIAIKEENQTKIIDFKK